MEWLLPVLGVVGLALAPLVLWLNARRASSGKVDTTEAATLWKEAEAMRSEYRVEAERLRAEVLDLRAEVAASRADVLESRAEVTVVRAEALRVTALLTVVRAEANALRVQLSRLVPPEGFVT